MPFYPSDAFSSHHLLACSQSVYSRHLLLGIDCYSKYAFYTTCKTLEAQEFVAFLEKLFEEQGPWQMVHTDNGGAFTAWQSRQAYRSLGTDEVHGCPYHPRTFLCLQCSNFFR